MAPTVLGLSARVVLDSRGEKTIEVEANVDGFVATAAAPSGKSRGLREVEPFPRGGPEEAVLIVRERVSRRLVGTNIDGLEVLDEALSGLDGTPNLSVIGGNTVLAVSIAVLSAAAKSTGKRLYEHLSEICGTEPVIPLPLGNVLGGGKHAGIGAPEIQEFLVIPRGAGDIMLGIQANALVHKRLGELLQRVVGRYPLGRGDEGGYAPPINNEKALGLVSEAASMVSDELGLEVSLGLDVAASNLYDERKERYVLASQGLYLKTEEFKQYLAELCDRYELIYLEDPFKEGDLDSFEELSNSLSRTYVCGDDLVVTRPELIKEAALRRAIRAAVIKPNQVGYLSITSNAAKVARSYNVLPVASHRSGETPDPYLAHIAVGLGCDVIKSGVVGGERVAKLNELLRIWDHSRGKIGISKI